MAALHSPAVEDFANRWVPVALVLVRDRGPCMVDATDEEECGGGGGGVGDAATAFKSSLDGALIPIPDKPNRVLLVFEAW